MSEPHATQGVICNERPYSMRSGRTPGTVEILFKGEVVAETTFRPKWARETVDAINRAYKEGYEKCFEDLVNGVITDDREPTKDEIIRTLATEVAALQSMEFEEQTEEEIIESAKERFKAIRKRTREIKNSGFPPYARLFSSALCHKGKGVYYRHAGMWEVEAKLEGGRLVVTTSDGPMKHAEGEEMTECTAEEWREENEGYL
jgi:hypothetical protein